MMIEKEIEIQKALGVLPTRIQIYEWMIVVDKVDIKSSYKTKLYALVALFPNWEINHHYNTDLVHWYGTLIWFAHNKKYNIFHQYSENSLEKLFIKMWKNLKTCLNEND